MGFALVGCTDGDTGAIQTGGLGGGDDVQMPPDAREALADASTGGMVCSGTAADVGLASAFTLNTPVYFSTGKFFVVRDSGGFYALTAACTHEGAVCAVSGTRFRCPRHGALFTFAGGIISGPVSQPLKHYAMCTLANGHLGVMTGSVVTPATRLVA